MVTSWKPVEEARPAKLGREGAGGVTLLASRLRVTVESGAVHHQLCLEGWHWDGKL